MQCCVEDGEDCPEDSEDTCKRLKRLLSNVFLDRKFSLGLLDKDRISAYEQCCPGEGEDCPKKDIDIDCDQTLNLLQKEHMLCCAEDGEDCPEDSEDTCKRLKVLLSNVLFDTKFSFGLLDNDRITAYGDCCPDEGEDCPKEDIDIDCDQTLNVLQKEHMQCCVEDGEDCPEDSEDTCKRLKLVLSNVLLDTKFSLGLLDKDRISAYEQCCPGEGEDCPEEDIDIDCDQTLNLLQKEHMQCCAEDGEDCPEDSEDTCKRLKVLLSNVFFERISAYEQCCPGEEGGE